MNPTKLDRPFWRFYDDDSLLALKAWKLGFTPNDEEAMELAARHRHFDCPQYDECLGKVADLGWAGFSCCNCPSFTGKHEDGDVGLAEVKWSEEDKAIMRRRDPAYRATPRPPRIRKDRKKPNEPLTPEQVRRKLARGRGKL